jgi:uncharacterized protein YggL (DUF469 family)
MLLLGSRVVVFLCCFACGVPRSLFAVHRTASTLLEHPNALFSEQPDWLHDDGGFDFAGREHCIVQHQPHLGGEHTVHVDDEVESDEFPQLDPLPARHSSAWMPHTVSAASYNHAEEKAVHIAFLEQHLLRLREAARCPPMLPVAARAIPTKTPRAEDGREREENPKNEDNRKRDENEDEERQGGHDDEHDDEHEHKHAQNEESVLDRISSIPLLEADGGLDVAEVAELVSIEEVAAIVREAEARVDRMLRHRGDQATETTDSSSVWHWSSSSSSSGGEFGADPSDRAAAGHAHLSRWPANARGERDSVFAHQPLADEDVEEEEQEAPENSDFAVQWVSELPESSDPAAS